MCAGTAVRVPICRKGWLCAHGKVKSAARVVHGKRALEVSSCIGKGQDGQGQPRPWAQGSRGTATAPGAPSAPGPELGTAPTATSSVEHSTGSCSCSAPGCIPSTSLTLSPFS